VCKKIVGICSPRAEHAPSMRSRVSVRFSGFSYTTAMSSAWSMSENCSSETVSLEGWSDSFRTQSTALQNKDGAKTQPCLTPDSVRNGGDSWRPTRAWELVLLWRSLMRLSSVSETPTPRIVFHRACLSAELKADSRSTYAMYSGLLNSRCRSDRRRSARTASDVDLPRWTLTAAASSCRWEVV